MRILRLDLERYGRFADVSLKLPADKDLCMILGRNEAGKSTCLSALLDLLFGFPTRVSYHFQHGHKALRVGALLAHSDGRETHLRRRRGNKNTLVAADETALNDALITPFQGGINRDQFERLFGLDQERLREGGEAMLRSDGAVGAILVEAGEGLKGLVQLQHRLTQELDRLHRAKRNQNTETARIQGELKEARDRLRQCLLSADEWQDALACEQRCTDLVQSLRTETLTLRETAARLAILARVKPMLARLDELAAAAHALGSLPKLADTIDQDRLKLRNQLIGDQARLAVATTELARVAQQLQALPAADPILGHSNRIAGFAETRGAVEKARQDSARREREIQASRTHLAFLAKQLGTPDGDSAIIQAPDALSRADLQQLESEGTRIQAKLDAAQNAVRQAVADLPVEDAAGDGNAAESLRAVQAQLRRLETRRDLPQQVEELASDRIRYRQARIELDQSLAALPYWTGTLDELLRLALPLRGAVEAELAARLERQEKLDRLLEQRATTKLEQERWQYVLDELAGDGPIPTDEAVSLARQERDQSWRLLRRRFIERRTDLEPGPALSPDQHGDAFELQITRADELIDARARESQRLARHGQAQADLAAKGRRLEELAPEIATAYAAIVAADAAWTAPWSRLGIAATTPRLMLEWLEGVTDIRTAATELAKESRALQSRQDALDKALSEFDQLESLSELAADPIMTVEQRLDRLTRRLTVLDEEASAQVELTGTLGQARKTLQQANETLNRAQFEWADWHGRWTIALRRVGLKVDTSLVATKAALELFSEIDTEGRNLSQAEHRLATMAADEAAFAAAVIGVASDLGLTMADQDPIAISRSLEQRQQAARQSHDQRQKLEGEHATRVQAVGDLEALIAEHEARARLLRTAAGANSEDELDDIVRRRKQLQELLHQQTGLQQQLLAEGGEHSEAFLRAEAASLDDVQLCEQRVQVDARLAQLDDAVVHAVAQHTEAIHVRQQLEQRTGAAAAAQEVAQRLAELGEVASQWARLRATHLLLNAAIERYRKRQSDPLLAKASHYLACLTCNACTGFAVDFDERDEPSLGVQRPTGEILPVSGLSEGTRDQLWLALRLAAIERHVAAAEPLPFIGDDVLVNFDDERATAALKALADLGVFCQVLLFTHHPHLVDLGHVALGPRLGVVELAP